MMKINTLSEYSNQSFQLSSTPDKVISNSGDSLSSHFSIFLNNSFYKNNTLPLKRKLNYEDILLYPSKKYKIFYKNNLNTNNLINNNNNNLENQKL